MNLQFGNYEQFRDFYMKANNSIRDILNRVYPNWRRRLQDDFLNSTKKLETKINPIIQDNKQTLSKVKDTLKGTSNKLQGVGSLAKGFKPTKLGTLGAAATIIDPRTTWNEKVLGGMLAFPATAPYALGGLAATQLGPKAINSYSDYKYNKDTRYNRDVFDNYLSNNLPSELKSLTPEENLKMMTYINNQIGKDTNDLQQELNQAIADNQAELDEWEYLLNNGPHNEPQTPSQQLDFGNGYSGIPTQSQGQTIQNAQSSQQVAPEQYVNSMAPIPQANIQTQPYNIQGMNTMPDRKDYQAGLNMDIDRFMDALKEANKDVQREPRDFTDSYKAMLGLLADSNAINQLRRENASKLLDQYKEAINRDRLTNNINQLNNMMVAGKTKAPISYVSANGNLNQIQLDQANNASMLPTNTNTSQQEFANSLKLNEELTPKQNELYKDIMIAAAVGEETGVDPLVYLGENKYGEQLLKNKGVIDNTIEGATQELRKLGPNTGAELIKKDKDLVNNLTVEDLKGNYDVYVTLLQQSGMSERQAKTLLNNTIIAQLNNQSQEYRTAMHENNANWRAELSAATNVKVAKIYKTLNAAGVTNGSYLKDAKAMSEILDNIYSIQNPQERAMVTQMVFPNGIPNIGNPDGGYLNISTSQYGTTPNQQSILRRARER